MRAGLQQQTANAKLVKNVSDSVVIRAYELPHLHFLWVPP